MIKYFSYGSNLNSDRMKERGVNFISRTFGILKDYKLVFNKIASRNPKEGYANIVVSKNSIVEGAIYEINDADIFLLDKYESYPKHYYRKEVEVQSSNELIKCITYIANDSKVMEGLKPSDDYLKHILKGKDLFTENYYNKLEKTELLK